MTADEMAIVEQLGDAWDAYLQLPVLHPSDRVDFMNAIHAAQRIVMARAAVRGLRRSPVVSE